MNLLTRLGNAWDNFRFRSSLSPSEVAEFRSYVQSVNTGAGYFSSWVNTSGESLNPSSAMRISTWFTCLQVRWDAVAMLPFNVFRVDGKSKQVAYDHPAYILHTRPNPSMTATQFWKLVQQKRDNYGNCYCPIYRDPRGRIVRVDIIEDNSEVKVYCSKETGELYYNWKGTDISGADMLHFKGLTLNSGKMGLSLTEYHAETVGRLRAIQKYSNRSISKNPGLWLTTDQQLPMNETQKKALKDYIAKETQEFGENGLLPALYNGFKIQTVGVNPKDALYLEQINATKEDIFGITKVPPKLAQNFQTGTTYNNSEQQSLDFLIWGLSINLKDIEDECNYKLFTEQERAQYFCKFNEKAILRLDAKTQAEVIERYFKMGAYSINDVLEILDRNPIENGDDHYVELNNLAPVRLQDEILEGRMASSADPADPAESGEERSIRMINWLKKQLNGHAVQ